MALIKYMEKRDFEHTPEPLGVAIDDEERLIFVVQRHHASHLHYDFRLELNGVLKSWAIPKGPSMNPTDKRLAMMVEDHPVDYATFEGTIPEGNYGAGRVDIWDHGTYEPVDENGAAITATEFAIRLQNGEINFKLKGMLLKGGFTLVHFKKEARSWLLIKHKDHYAVAEDYNSEDYASTAALAYTEMRNSTRN